MSNPYDIALAFAGSFVEKARGEETISVTTAFAPKFVLDIVEKVHGEDRTPDSWVYKILHQLSATFLEVIDTTQLWPNEDEIHEMCESFIPIYYYERIEWLASNLIRIEYCDAAKESGLCSVSDSIMDIIAAGIYYEYDLIAHKLLEELKKVDLNEQ